MLKGLTVGFIITGYLAGGHAFSAEQPPNLAVIFADDLGYGGIGAYRAPYPSVDDKPAAYKHTPNIDRLTEEGVRLRPLFYVPKGL